MLATRTTLELEAEATPLTLEEVLRNQSKYLKGKDVRLYRHLPQVRQSPEGDAPPDGRSTLACGDLLESGSERADGNRKLRNDRQSFCPGALLGNNGRRAKETDVSASCV